MTEHQPAPPARTPAKEDWRVWSLSIVGLILVFAALFGFIIMPLAQGRQIGLDAWSAICRAIGVQPGTPAMRQPLSTAQARPVTDVAWDPAILARLASGDRSRGAQLAVDVCSACHGEAGISPSDAFPHLSGQSAAAIYKQLHDYKSGSRAHPQMTPVAVKLSETQLADISAYFAGANASLSLGRRSLTSEESIDRLVRVGDPSRGIPSCNSCHGSGVGGPIETPTLVGQHAAYLERQMQLYATRERANDIYGRMRSIAGRLSPEEMKALAAYYQGTS